MSLRSDRVLVVFALGCLGWLALYAALTYLGQDRPGLARFTGEVLYLVPVATLLGLSIYAARRTTGRTRTAWRLLVASNVAWVCGDTVWAYYVYNTPGGDPPVPTLADAFYLLRFLLTMPAIMIALGLKLRGLLDALLVAAAGAAIGWQLVISPLVPASWDPDAFVTFLYPVFSVVIFSVLVALMLTGARRVPAAMVLFTVAFGFAVVMDGVYAYVSVLHQYTSSTWLNVGWQAEILLLCLAALVAARHSRDEEDQPTHEVTFLPALVAVLVVGGLAAADLILSGHLSRVTLSVAMLLLIGLLVRQIVASRDRTRLTEQLRSAAITDALTGVYNRRFFEEMLAADTDGHGAPRSVVLVDLDHFKAINDTHGHMVGDAVLAEVAERLRRSLRAGDLLCRYGGEEFVCLLPRTDATAARELAERLRVDLRSTPVTVPGVAEPLALTASFGVACAGPADSGQLRVDQLVDDADRALYRAKAQGRDRVLGCGPREQAEAVPLLDLPPELVWFADELDRIRGDGARSAAVGDWAWRTAAALGLDEATRLHIAAAARLHGIGCLSVGCPPPAPGGADADRDNAARAGPEQAARLLADLAHRPELEPLLAAAHERHDGSGYPRGLAGSGIPIGARIIAVCDGWADACRGATPASGAGQARRVLREERGTRYDPAVVDVLLALAAEGALTEPVPARPGGPAAAAG
ncbi:bifunctional diguanylate cyclase/phosphohydrolase [Catellatospora vulcania]|uniref:bifunctional diguanylate cyclase/phosphohydrolase n=1 Tax=Catellatospora vulcania TaxID=1460450 RepID=UPI0012D482F5|nr:diguanylate cyclase [Catellatospora vulcania]